MLSGAWRLWGSKKFFSCADVLGPFSYNRKRPIWTECQKIKNIMSCQKVDIYNCVECWNEPRHYRRDKGEAVRELSTVLWKFCSERYLMTKQSRRSQLSAINCTFIRGQNFCPSEKFWNLNTSCSSPVHGGHSAIPIIMWHSIIYWKQDLPGLKFVTYREPACSDFTLTWLHCTQRLICSDVRWYIWNTCCVTAALFHAQARVGRTVCKPRIIHPFACPHDDWMPLAVELVSLAFTSCLASFISLCSSTKHRIVTDTSFVTYYLLIATISLSDA